MLKPEFKVGDTVRHYKRGLYVVESFPLLEATGEAMVCYRSLETARLWVRPLSEFKEKFRKEGEP